MLFVIYYAFYAASKSYGFGNDVKIELNDRNSRSSSYIMSLAK